MRVAPRRTRGSASSSAALMTSTPARRFPAPQRPGGGAPDDLGGVAQPPSQGAAEPASPIRPRRGRGRRPDQRLGILEQSRDRHANSSAVRLGHVPEILEIIERVHQRVGAQAAWRGRESRFPQPRRGPPDRGNASARAITAYRVSRIGVRKFSCVVVWNQPPKSCC